MGKIRSDIDNETLTALYKSGIQKRLINIGVYVFDQGHKLVDRGKCLVCNVTLTAKFKVKFCSQSCSAKFYNRINHPLKICPQCGKGHRSKKYCSRECGWAAKKRPITEETLERRRITNLVGVRKYQAKKLNQTPHDADFELIRLFYASCPDGYEVDHIIPISKGGLHHQDNLQYLLMSDNRRKSNKLNWTSSQEVNGN